MIEAADILAPGGVLSERLGAHFEPRPQQGQMASAVAAAMENRSHVLIEAGTGIGKSFAYLVPAMLRVLRRGETVVVATNTIALQEQLVTKDVPLLRETLDPFAELAPDGLPREVRPVLVKGRGNYMSIRRLKLASQRQDRLFSDPAARRSLHVIEEWAYGTEDGTLSTLPPIERPGVWDRVQSDSGNCMGRRCPHYESCFYQTARREMENANLLICNHALFFSDLALRAQDVGFLPKYDHVILDEAHGVEDVASEHFGVSLTEGRIQHLLSTLHARNGKGYLANAMLLSTEPDRVQKAIVLVEQAGAAARAFFDSLPRPEGSNTGVFGSASIAPGTVRVREAGTVANTITPAFRELSLRLAGLKDIMPGDADRFELNAYSQRAAMVADAAEALVSQTVPKSVYWVEHGGGETSRQRTVGMACAPIEVGPLLKEHLFRQDYSVVLTSATLATRRVKESEPTETAETAFAHTLARLGCEGAKTLQLGSPFDYARQVEFYIDTTVDHARGGNARGITSNSGPGRGKLAERILHHLEATEGGAFVLFTSFATLNSVASALAGPLAHRGWPLLAQGRDGSRTLILQRFRENEHSVLLGAASFWQGVDVRGRGLRNVIITKLPFDPPDRPLTQARCELIEERGGNPFMEDSIPRAVIRFKQGFGRLIRSQEDSGRVVVMDSRILTARYGRLFLQALPEGVEPRVVGAEEERQGPRMDDLPF